MVRSLTRRGMPKPFAILLAMLMALYFVPISALPAAANTSGNTTFGEFEMDGNFYEGTTNTTVATGPDGAPVDWGSAEIKAQVDVIPDPLESSDPTVFANGSKEDTPSGWDDSSSAQAPGKGDIGNLYIYDRLVGGSQYLFGAFERESSTGTVTYWIELNQKPNVTNANGQAVPNRTSGDLRVAVSQSGNGAFEVEFIEKWSGSAWVGVTLPAAAFQLRVNDSTITAGDLPKWTDVSLTEKKFVEFSFNLSALGLNLDCPSTGFSSAFLRSQAAGANANSELKDYTTGPINVPSNCSQFKIEKRKGTTDGALLPGATFSVSPNPLPGQTQPNPLNITDGGANDADGTANGTVLVAPAKPGTYTVTEVTPPLGYIGQSGSKEVTAQPYAQVPAVVVFTNDHGTARWVKKDAGTGDLVCCATFRVQGTSGAAQTLGVDFLVTDNAAGDQDSDAGQIKVNDLPTGGYTVTETVAPQGYDLPPAGQRTRTFSISAQTPNVTVGSAFEDPRTTVPLKVKKVAENAQSTTIQGAVFELWLESGNSPGLQRAGADADTKVGECTTGSDGTCTVAGATWHNSYYWYEVSVPAPYNLPNQRVQGPIEVTRANVSEPFATTVFADPKSKIVTQATNGSLPNAKISDTATLSGVNNAAAGTVTFDLYYTGAAEPTKDSCVPGNLVTAGIAATEAVDGPDDYTTGPVAVTKAGYYTWVAHYSGDNNGNRAVSGECDDVNETSIVVAAEPGIVTVVPQSHVDLSAATTTLTDSATLSGASSGATGAVTFALYGPFTTQPAQGDCTTGKLVATVDSTEAFTGNGTYTSKPVTVTQVGIYTWKATYTSGDANNKDATHACGQVNETVEVGKAAPKVTTEAQQAEVTLGSSPTSLTDKATLSGATSGASGSVSFSLYGPFAQDPGSDSCTVGKLVKTVDPVGAFAGNGTYTSLPVEVTKAGYYTWVATYSGDANNKTATHECGQAEETTLVRPAAPSITTDAGDDVVIGVNGATLADTATLSGATAGASGTITFKLYGPFASDPTGNTTACVDAGDGKNLVGTVTNSAVNGNDDYSSPGVAVSTTGFYVWVASYSGDDNNLSATHPCGDASEVVKVTPRQPVITTDVPARVMTLGADGVQLSDTATLSQATSAAGGAITFQLYGPFDSRPGADSCVAGSSLGGPVGTTAPVSGNGTYTSLQKKVATAGFYTWIATYGGDTDNRSATHACGLASETVEVEKAPTSITTEVSDDSMRLAPTASLVDRATLSGATVTPAAGGTISFTLYGPFDTDPTDAQGDSDVCVPANAVGTVAATSAVSGPGTYRSEPVVVSVAGWYVWLATYSGDANNTGSTHGCGDAKEVTEVQRAAPAITTQVPSETARLAPSVVLTDTAALTGATTNPAATGSITFSLYGPFSSEPDDDSCTVENRVGTRSVPVSGPGSYSPVSGITVHEVGFYTWVARYGGDSNNRSATHECGLDNETVEVLKTRGTITTDSVDRVRLSSGTTSISDEATLSGVTSAPKATGTIEFRVYGPFTSQPGAQSCSLDKLVGGGPYTVQVSGPGTYESPDVQVKEAGYYVWVATYSGDANNESATHACGMTEETTIVDKAIPTISTQVAAASVDLPSASLVDTATLSGGTTDPVVSGTITFRLYGPFASAPNVESCGEGQLVASRVVQVTDGNGSYASPAVVVGAAGYYTWVAMYSGDANNEAATHPCGLQTETVKVEKAPHRGDDGRNRPSHHQAGADHQRLRERHRPDQ